MKLQDLQYLPPTALATSQTVYRVQRLRARRGTARVGPLKLPPAGTLTSRFAVGTALVGYFAESPETAVYESLVVEQRKCVPSLFPMRGVVGVTTLSTHTAK
jgi:hypothetical protein